ncbi:unnamed protein product [Soboliphyme baturini]|uniref:Uncharacterized protein n=1 Tax=Soboliphyme baturini TaxID=241478 RepID=A0A183J505_9BILA|nr:unnamed protein product [Soboliphyme baturini]
MEDEDSRLPLNAADFSGLACPAAWRSKKNLVDTRGTTGVKEKKATFKKWFGNKERSTRMRYVEGRKAAAKAKADSLEKFGEVLE